MDKACSWVQGEQGAPAVLLRGGPIPLAATFRQLGVDIAIGGSKTMGTVLSRRLEAGRSALRRLPHLSTYDRRERAISTLVTPLALHGVAVAPVTEPDLRGLETAVVRALWGAARLSQAKEVIFIVLSNGHRVSPIMHMRYERLLWLACLPRRPGVTQVFAQAIGELGGRPPGTGPVGRALRTAASLGWTPREGCWCWDVPGQEHPLHFVQEPLRQLQHRVRDSLRCHSSRQLEARRPVTFGGLGDGADGSACPCGAAGSLHGVGEVAAARSYGRGPVDSGPSVTRHADQLRVPPLRRGARGRSPRPVGMPEVGRCQGDVARLAELCGRVHPPPGTARPVAVLPAESGPLSPPAGAGGGPGPPRRVPIPPLRHVLGGSRCLHGS